MIRKFHSFIVSAAMFAGIGFTSAVAGKEAHAVTVSQVEARTTLKDMQGLAAAVAGEADQLFTFARNVDIDASQHRLSLLQLKQKINQLGTALAGLEARRDSLDANEQEAMEKIHPLLKDAAVNVEAATRYYNEHLGRFWSPRYRAFAEQAAGDAEQITKTIQRCRADEERQGHGQGGVAAAGASE
jgi:soluble lytic murein transglycosylase-like protein